MTKKGRPAKVRYIQRMPKTITFSPRGKPGRPDEIELSIDQLEAIKLADFQNFSQHDGAQAMRISRASFGRTLREARRRIADALVNGKIIHIRMGDAQVGITKKDLNLEILKTEVEKFSHRHQQFEEEIAAARDHQSVPTGETEVAEEIPAVGRTPQSLLHNQKEEALNNLVDIAIIDRERATKPPKIA